jgi:hypothetical protein
MSDLVAHILADLRLAVDKEMASILAAQRDGGAYHSALGASECDRARQRVPEGLGLRFYRIRSLSVFCRREEQFLNEARAEEIRVLPALLPPRHKKPAYVQRPISKIPAQQRADHRPGRPDQSIKTSPHPGQPKFFRTASKAPHRDHIR